MVSGLSDSMAGVLRFVFFMSISYLSKKCKRRTKDIHNMSEKAGVLLFVYIIVSVSVMFC